MLNKDTYKVLIYQTIFELFLIIVMNIKIVNNFIFLFIFYSYICNSLNTTL